MSKRNRSLEDEPLDVKQAYKLAKRAYKSNPDDPTLFQAFKKAKVAYKGAQVEVDRESKPEAQLVEVKTSSSPEVIAFRQQNQLSIEGPDAQSDQFVPLTSFSATAEKLPEAAKCLMKITSSFKAPTTIQAQCWPISLTGRDLIGIAETGSGKTLAFSIPAIAHILATTTKSSKKSCARPRMLILSPTRELAMQIQDTCSQLGSYCALNSVVVYGGVSKRDQRNQLLANGGADIVVATPGRLIDFLTEEEKAPLSLSKVSQLVLDEADRMLDLGFEEAVRKIISFCPSQRLTQMFSATWPPTIRELAKSFLRPDAIRVTIGVDDLVACSRVQQIVEVVDPNGKLKRLIELLQKYHSSRKNRVLVFVLYKKEATQVEQAIRARGWKCTAIHGDKSQDSRTSALSEFKHGSNPLLIATDVAARGLDIPDVSHVINYSFPLTIEDYIHRIGRTGRAGKTGLSHTLFTIHDKGKAGLLVNVLKEANQPVPESLTAFGVHTKKKEHKMYGAHFKEVDLNKKGTKVKLDSDEE